MIEFFAECFSDLRTRFLALDTIAVQDEITFFKKIKPEVLGFLLYFNKVHKIELKRPTGSNDTQKRYYEKELQSLTFFFGRNLDFYQYYRANSTCLDEHYFLRKKTCYEICVYSAFFIRDPLFSTGYDYKVAKIICNEMLRIYLNKKKHGLEKQEEIRKNRELLPETHLKWTASKTDAIEVGYAFHESGVFNNGHADIKEIMNFFETNLNIDLGNYYRSYIAIKNRKKDRTSFLKRLIDCLLRRMDKDDSD